MTGTDRDDEFDEPLELTDVQSKPRKKSFLARFVGAVTVLVEMGFITNSQDEANLNAPAYRTKLVERLARAIVSYLVEYGPQR